MKKMKDIIQYFQKTDMEMLFITVCAAIIAGLGIWIQSRLWEGYEYNYCMLCDGFKWFVSAEDDFCRDCQWIVDAVRTSD